MNNSTIVHIPLEQLYHHPDNPRKDLGDLTELADSIRAKGVMQNLTVVPMPETSGYYVVIGNRRMEASKLAGLSTLPCIISDMSHKEQVATMLLENMQRVDLTPYEQAQGFQMMIDFGDSVQDIAEQTGFSQTTVRRRLKMAELDGEILRSVSDRQLSLTDFDRLAELDSIEERNHVLTTIGTNNFGWSMQQALNRQKTERQKERWRQHLLSLGLAEISGEEAWERDDLRGFFQCQLGKEFDALKANDRPLENCFFHFDYGWVYLTGAKLPELEKKKREAERLAKEHEKRYARHRELHEVARERRIGYIKTVTEASARDLYFKECVPVIALQDTYEHYLNRLEELYGLKGNKLSEEIKRHPYHALLSMAFIAKGGLNRYSTMSRFSLFSPSPALDALYKFLESIGYPLPEGVECEETMLVKGTHEVYLKEEKK